MDLFLILLNSVILIETSILFAKFVIGRNRHIGQKSRRKVFVDTSTLMDGRILSVAKTGFLGDEILIPRSVIRELQLLADGNDPEKRTRARFGLDVVRELERVELAQVEIFADDIGRVKVDERLMELAKENHGIILTNDFNLIKVASIEHIDAININELAQSLRSEYLPGDILQVKIIGTGSNPKQGIAYLPDGTMVVVDDAERYAGKGTPVEIEFVRYLQTNAGKMMFAKLAQKTTKSKSRKTQDSKLGRKRKTSSKTSDTKKNKRTK